MTGRIADNTERIFLTKGLYLEGYRNELDKQLCVLEALDTGFRDRLLEFMPREKVWGLFVNYDLEDKIHFSCFEQFFRMKDPIEKIRVSFVFMEEISDYFLNHPEAAESGKAEAGDMEQVEKSLSFATCTYCKSRYIMDLNPSCPGCL